MVRDYYLENPLVQAEDESVNFFDYPQSTCKSKISSFLSALSPRKRQEKETMQCIHISAPIMTAPPPKSRPISPRQNQGNMIQQRPRFGAIESRKRVESSKYEWEADEDDENWG
ncbi:hypothetical protein HRG_011706 [Hirsutella rhossiliensis]|uniref:Uncharacterized protein n=1 Tax=Hirsutella rhossiliensis TaxID=111463 RepID=A0A9P8MLG5_9HYPO|nr:uncharacterized protein HRG_11706 [Hirsutella rhossiliensis]KAH0957157.1 hypothetical protein HRG_11706 [Hirsutella rhossiliensis]